MTDLHLSLLGHPEVKIDHIDNPTGRLTVL